jgi:lysozyme
MKRATLRAQLIHSEGLRTKPYKDTVGKLTIGVGRNLDDKGITEEESLYLLDNDIDDAVDDAREVIGSIFDELDDVRQHVLIDMALNLGRNRLKGFRRMVEAVQALDFEEAGRQMLDSKWATQVGSRALRLERMMRTGVQERMV